MAVEDGNRLKHEVGFFHTSKVWVQKLDEMGNPSSKPVCIDVTDINEIIHIPKIGSSRFTGNNVNFAITGAHELTCEPIKPGSPQSDCAKMVKVVVFE